MSKSTDLIGTAVAIGIAWYMFPNAVPAIFQAISQPAKVTKVAKTPTRTYGPSDTTLIVETSRSNEARFDRDFKGETFIGTMAFDGLERELLGSGWRVSFRYGGVFDKVDCRVGDQTANGMIDWAKGRQVAVTGTIRTTIIGSIELDDCRFS
jgi:hypothetical protein